jgi:hypothetical protein
MNNRICCRFGIVAGASTGLLINLLATPACCGTQSLSFAQTVLYGILVSVVSTAFAAAFACLVSRRPKAVLLTIAMLIAVVDGALLGPLAYVLPHPTLSLFVCALLGALLAILLCWLLCLERSGLGRIGA